MRRLALACLALFASAASVGAQDGPPPGGAGDSGSASAVSIAAAPLEVYGRLPAYELSVLSAAGDRVAHVVTQGEGRAVLVNALPGGELLGGARVGEVKVRDLTWVGSDHVLIITSAAMEYPGGVEVEVSQGEILNVANNSLRSVFQNLPDVYRNMLSVHVAEIDGKPQIVFEAQNDDTYEIALYALDPLTLRSRVLERNHPNTRDYVVTPDGRRLARANYRQNDGLWQFQVEPPSGGWRTVWSTTALVDPPVMGGEGPEGDTVAVLASPDAGAPAIWRLLGRDGVWRPLPFEGDPNSLLYHPRTGRLIGAAYREAEGWRYEFSDPAAARTWRSIQRAFDGRDPQLISWSDDLRKIMVFSWGPTDAGAYHFVDLDAGRADVLGEQYPDIGPDQVGEIRAISYEAGDGMRIPGYLTLPPGVTEPRGLPLVVFPHGGPAVRDEKQFDWWAQAMASRGYAVLQPNFRGSSGLGLDHLEAGYGEWGRKMQTDLSDGVRWLADQGIVDPSRVCIVGASYGGYAALAGATVESGVYRCAVSVAGVSDLRAMLRWTADRMGRTNNAANRYWNRFMGADGVGDRSLDQRSPAQLADRATAPILLIHGRDDTVVPYSQTSAMASALRRAGKSYQLVELEGEDHWLSRAETRQRMLRETIAFLETHNPAN
jgi:dipeptidyl aminopeptidase/acylaminoacyl peptidase